MDIDKTSWKLPLLTSLLAGVALCLLMPFSMYDSNPSEFPRVSYAEVLVYSGVLAVAVTGGVFLVLVAVRRFAPRMLLPLVGLLVGVSIALYAQGNLIGADYGAMDGHVIQWDAMRSISLANSIVWCVFSFVPVLTSVFVPKAFERIVRYVVPIFLSYVVLLSAMLVFADLSAFDRRKPVGFTLDKLMELSSDRNLVVIVLDAFDRAIFDRLLEEDPSWRSRFAGFTYYHNTVSAFCYTNLALPQIVSGFANQEDGLSTWEYQRKAYDESPFLKKAMGLGYKVYAYYDEDDGPVEGDLDWADSFGSAIENANRFVSSDGIRHYGMLYFYSAFRYLPHELKKCWCAAEQKLRERFRLFSEKVEEALSLRLSTESFSLVPEKRVKIYHCFSIHVPMFSLERARENLEMVCRFVEKVREAGVYDKTDFFVMADHGSVNRCRPLFMCSNGTDEFKVSEMPFSYRHLCEAFVDSLNGRPIRPIEATPAEMVPIIDDPKRSEITTVDGKFFAGIGTEFSGSGLELLATTAEMDVVVTNGTSRMAWNGNDAIIGVPVDVPLQDRELTLVLTFDGKLAEGVDVAVQYAYKTPEEVECTTVPSEDSTDVIIKLPDMTQNPDKRFVKLHLRKWPAAPAPSIRRVKLQPR